MTRLRQLVCDVCVLTKGYWGSEERWSARLLLTSIIGFNLGLVGVNVLQNRANGALFTALQQRNAHGFYRAFIIVILLILLYLVVAVLRVYLDQTLQLRWRRWLTDQYVTRWLADRTFYRMRFSGRVDNPDQRISEDVRLFIERTMALGVGLLNALATLASFAALLWYLSGSLPSGWRLSCSCPRLYLHARRHGRWRGWPYPPTGGTAVVAAGRSRTRDAEAGRRQRGSRGLPLRHAVASPARPLALSRQSLPTFDPEQVRIGNGRRPRWLCPGRCPRRELGAGPVRFGERGLVVQAHEQLIAEGIHSRVISMPSWDILSSTRHGNTRTACCRHM